MYMPELRVVQPTDKFSRRLEAAKTFAILRLQVFRAISIRLLSRHEPAEKLGERYRHLRAFTKVTVGFYCRLYHPASDWVPARRRDIEI
jgi:hypothetical protein